MPKRSIWWNGELLSLAEIARREGVPPGRLYDRVRNQGMTIEQAVNTPLMCRDGSLDVRKPFWMLSKGEVNQIVYKKCRKCKWRGYAGNTYWCDYYELSGWKRRGCDPRDCEKYKEKGSIVKKRNGIELCCR